MTDAVILDVRVGEDEVHAQTARDDGLQVGDPAWLTFKRYHLFDKTSGTRLRSHPETSP
jgi:hypothetical protein